MDTFTLPVPPHVGDSARAELLRELRRADPLARLTPEELSLRALQVEQMSLDEGTVYLVRGPTHRLVLVVTPDRVVAGAGTTYAKAAQSLPDPALARVVGARLRA